MKPIFGLIILFSVLVSACGLKYTPIETREDASTKRRNSVYQYIKDSYKDSAVVYESIVFAPVTTVKPYNHRRLDSLYEIKYTNEQNNVFDKELEEKINNQKIVIANSREKIQHIEHHVYSIKRDSIATVYYADIDFGMSDTVTGFTITQTFEFPSSLLPIFKSYITRESIVYPNYGPTNNEIEFYDFFDEELARRPESEKNSFMITLLNTLLLARNTRSIETKSILQNVSVVAVEKRVYNRGVDVFQKVDGVWEDNKLVNYEVSFTTPLGAFQGFFSPYFELIRMEKIKN